MLRDRNIAFFIDVDNASLTGDNYGNVIQQLSEMGNILFGKIYGAGDRKHREIFVDAELHGYKIERAMRVKRRGRKDFDNRIFIDVVDAVNKTPAIDAVCIVAMPTDMVYLYSYLRSRGIKIIALDNSDEASCSFIDEVIDLGQVLQLKFPQNKRSSSAKQPVTLDLSSLDASSADEADETAQDDWLLQQIRSLQSSAALDEQQQPAANAQSEAAASKASSGTASNAASQDAPQTKPSANIVDEANALLNMVAEMQQENARAPQAEQSAPQQAPQAEAQPAGHEDKSAVQPEVNDKAIGAEVKAEPQPEPQQSAATDEPQQVKAQSAPQPEQPSTAENPSAADKGDIDRLGDIIEDMRKKKRSDNTQEFVADIRKLLDDLL